MCMRVCVCTHVCELMAQCNTYYSGNATIGDKHTPLVDRCAAASSSHKEPKKRVAIIPPLVPCSSTPVMR